MTALQIPTFSPPRNLRSTNHYYHSWKDFTSNYSSKIKDCKFAKHLQRMTALQIPTFSPPRNLRSANYYYHSWKDFTSNYSSKKLQICKHLLPCCYILCQLLNDPCHSVGMVADGWFVLREEYCWLVAGGWFVLREKYC
jgi:protein tyrosine phosphatase